MTTFVAICGSGHCHQDITHGTSNGYKKHRCRCSACVAWHRTPNPAPSTRVPPLQVLGMTAAERAARVGIVYPPSGGGKYPLICRRCGFTASFDLPGQRRKKAWSHVLIHEEQYGN